MEGYCKLHGYTDHSADCLECQCSREEAPVDRKKNLMKEIKYFQEISDEDAHLLIEGMREKYPWAEFQKMKRVLELIREQ